MNSSARFCLTSVAAAFCAIWLTSFSCGDETPAAVSDENAEFFETEVVAILTNNCLKCHSGGEPKGELDLTTRDSILRGGESGDAAVNLQSAADSILLQAINYDGLEMPPTGQMSPAEIGVLTKWVELGMPWSAGVKQLEYQEPHAPPTVNEETKKFWSFQKVVRPEVPQIEGEWGSHPIDAFIAARLAKAGLQPNGKASPETLIRRAYYDLTGLPPSREEVAAFVADPSEEAWVAVIDRLLNSPQYGEHWGRHWLDLVRFAETNSYERDDAKPFVWRYRDYVIQALNADKPYDDFVREQLAGDELENATPESFVATGYYRLGRWDDEPADPQLAFYDDVDDIITTTSQTFLGLTVNCARCHDHKIDPIPQRDYYSLLAFFRNIRRYGVRGHDTVLSSSVREIDQPEMKRLHDEAITRYENDLRDANRQLEEIEKLAMEDFSDVEREEFQYEMNRVPLVKKRVGTKIDEQQFRRYRDQTRRRNDLRNKKPTGLASALVVKENGSDVPPTHLLLRGNPHAEGDEVAPGFPQVLSPPEPRMTPMPEGSESSGRRRVLADWIASGDNPLTARVMVNRIWQYHFGRGIVRSSSDFGFQGTPPTHPELLDWLAAEFVAQGWSLKTMHRQIMTSLAWQMSSQPTPEALAADETNELFSRFDMRRLAAEEIRDSILWANGSLNAADMFGPSIYTVIPQEVLAGQSRPGSGWGNSPPDQRNRRSVYIHVKRSLITPLISSFDGADPDQTCPVRFVTVQPTQALGMLNSEFINREAQVFADYLRRLHPDDRTAQIHRALWQVLQREPAESEIQRGSQLMDDLMSNEGLSNDDALKYFCLVAFNLNEFMYLD